MTYESIGFEIKDSGIGVLSINRPKALNALNSLVLKELQDFLTKAEERTDLKCLILTGSGEKAFVAGADIAEMSALNKEQATEFSKLGQNVTRLLEKFPCPVIAAVNGFALGGGCELAISCDFILASTKAVFGQPEVALGLIPGFGGTVRLARFVGWPMARDLIYSGRKINAEEALRVGLVNKVVEPANLLEEATNAAKEIVQMSPYAVKMAKKAMNDIASTSDLDASLHIESSTFGYIFGSHDQVEGTKAFLEKRKANFKGE